MRPEGGAVVWLPRCHLAVWSLTLPSGLLPPREGHLAPFLLVSSILPTFLYFCISPPFFLSHTLLSPSHLSFLSLIQSTDNNHCTCSHTKIAHLSELQRDWRMALEDEVCTKPRGGWVPPRCLWRTHFWQQLLFISLLISVGSQPPRKDWVMEQITASAVGTLGC